MSLIGQISYGDKFILPCSKQRNTRPELIRKQPTSSLPM